MAWGRVQYAPPSMNLFGNLKKQTQSATQVDWPQELQTFYLSLNWAVQTDPLLKSLTFSGGKMQPPR